MDDPYASSSLQGDDSTYNYSGLRWPHVEAGLQRSIERRFFEEDATIHFERLQELPFWTPLHLRWDRLRVRSIVRKAVALAKVARRPLSATELDAISEHANASVRKLVWTCPISVALAGVWAFNGRNTYKFPFYRPKMTRFNPFYFPIASMPHIKGIRASMVWHGVRAMAYLPITALLSLIVMNSVGETSFQVRVLRDSRLGALGQAVRSNAKSHVAQDQQIRVGSQPVGNGAARSAGLPGSASDTANGATRTWGASPSSQSQWGPAAAQAQSSNKSDWDSDPFEDDGSPISPSVRRAEAMQRGGSAWDRLRQQSQSKSQADSSDFAQGDSSGQETGWGRLRQDAAPNTREGSRGSENFAYSRQDEERESKNYEKEQAQKEFDALLESERRGESSNRRR